MTVFARTLLATPYADTSAGELRLSLTAEPRVPLARRDFRIGGRSVSLRLLGASHQVIVDGCVGGCVDDGHVLCETVACLTSVGTPLPETYTDGAYRFAARVRTPSPAEFDAAVTAVSERVRAHLESGRPALLGNYPGSPSALTAIVADATDGAIGWRTWHTYPQTGEVVETTGSLDRPEPR